MKLIHMSDLHIGLKLYNRDLSKDQEYIFTQIKEYVKEEQPDAVIIAGDIYDKSVPTQEAVSLFDGFINMLSLAAPKAHIMLISGNHDNAWRINVFRSILKKNNVHMVGLPPMKDGEYIEKVVLNDEYGRVNFYLLPFVKPSMIRDITQTEEDKESLTYNEAIKRLIARENIDINERNILVSHQFYIPKGSNVNDVERMDSEIRTAGNIDEVSAEILEPFDYAALGHIHKPMKAGSEYIRYSGTPMPYSVGEAGQEKGIIKIELSDKNTRPKITVLALTPLRQVRVIKDTYEEILKKPTEDYVTIILMDKEDIDTIDMQERLHNAFPNLLEIRREAAMAKNYEELKKQEEIDPYNMCQIFAHVSDEEEKNILMDVINTVKGAM